MLYAAKSHIGLVRQMNQDGFFVNMDGAPWRLMIVADGMGGASAGEVASKMAIETTANNVHTTIAREKEDPSFVLKQAVNLANHAIWRAAQEIEAYDGMGTTLVAVLCDDLQVTFAHVGDSRGYVFHEGQLRQVTEDHSLVAELVRRGQLTEEEAKHHPQRNIVTRSLGTAQYSEPDIYVVPWQEGDGLLLCTDGLSNLVTEEEFSIALAIAAQAPSAIEVEHQVEGLINLALERGAPDNITLILAVNREERVVQ